MILTEQGRLVNGVSSDEASFFSKAKRDIHGWLRPQIPFHVLVYAFNRQINFV